MDAIALPVKWQEWKIVETIGSGSFGTVYRAEKNDGVVSSVSAIKVIEVTAAGLRTAALMRRFKTDEAAREYLWGVVQHCAEEIRTMYRLQGESNLVSIQDHLIEEMEDQVGWRLFIRMEYLESFNDYQTTYEITQRDIIHMGISLCGALEKCEKMNILHRDIKPENIFVSSSGEFKLGDFGVSRVLEATHAQYTSEGTFGYMAPEVYKGQPCGKEADIYSLGLVLYTLANRNCEPFVDPQKQLVSYSDLQNAFDRRMKGDALPAPSDASPALAKILLKACAYRPSARYRTAADFRAALEPLAKPKRRMGPLWIALAAVVALLGAAWYFLPQARGLLFPGEGTPAISGIGAAIVEGGEIEPTEPPAEATEIPAMEPPVEPTEAPTTEPTEAPTAEPTAEPTEVPTAEPTAEPTAVPATEPPAGVAPFEAPEGYVAEAGREGWFVYAQGATIYGEIICQGEEAASSEAEVGRALARLMEQAHFARAGELTALRSETPSIWAWHGTYVSSRDGSRWMSEVAAVYDAGAGRLFPAVLLVNADQEPEAIEAATAAFEAMLFAAAGG